MDMGSASEDESGDDINETRERPTEKQRAWINCSAFIATILVIVRELTNEQNLLAVVIIGGSLAVLNILITASSLDKAQALEKTLEEEELQPEDTSLREQCATRGRAKDMTSIDLWDLPNDADMGNPYEEFQYDKLERAPFLPRRPRHPDSFERRRYVTEVDMEEMEPRRMAKPKKRSRRLGREEEEEHIKERVPRRNRNLEAWERKRRARKSRRERSDGMEAVDRQRDWAKRERRSRDKRNSKKKKRVTIASGSAERIIIGEV